MAASALLAALACCAPAGAHALATSAVLVDLHSRDVGLEVQIPIDRLAFGLGKPYTAANVLSPASQAVLGPYVQRHIAATGRDGRAWSTSVAHPRVEGGGATRGPRLVYSVTLTPPDHHVTSFDLRYDVLVERLVSHRVIAAVRTQVSDGVVSEDGSRTRALGVYDYDHQSLRVDADGSVLTAVISMARLGVSHVSEGSDHLLFLLTLLLPAPLLAAGRRWRRSDDGRQAARRIVHVVTAFALGHSLTLALAASGVIDPPTGLIEILVALSIAVSALHAMRPLVPGGEARIAFAFGLVHGVAFAETLGQLGLAGKDLVVALLGFNAGIEVTQLTVVALVMPSVWVLSATRAYAPVRLAVGAFAFCAAIGWGLERSGLIDRSPLQPVTEGAIAQPLVTAAGIALFALLVSALDRSVARPPKSSSVRTA